MLSALNHLPKILSSLQLQKNDARHVMNFVQRDELSCRAKQMQSYSGVSNTLASAYTCVSKRARARRVGVRGSLARNKARTNKRALAASLFPPQKNKAANDRASTSCEVSLE